MFRIHAAHHTVSFRFVSKFDFRIRKLFSILFENAKEAEKNASIRCAYGIEMPVFSQFRNEYIYFRILRFWDSFIVIYERPILTCGIDKPALEHTKSCIWQVTTRVYIWLPKTHSLCVPLKAWEKGIHVERRVFKQMLRFAWLVHTNWASGVRKHEWNKEANEWTNKRTNDQRIHNNI